ncbi:MAG: DJ-1/PfpI family protein [Treponema sp.]|jgi:4-methyl-5(b-hydroxyethyl)-thiazole monophosphate biosynthesis|nr:DJ-1/PfpI family protein [Treponema sp.]
MAKKALVLLADGFEEVEAVTPIDYLRRAGVAVTVATVAGSLAVRGSHGITVTADALLSGLGSGGWDAVVLPGGMPGASNLAASAPAGQILRDTAAAGKLVAAICASPAVALAPWGLLDGRRWTCYPGMEDRAFAAAPALKAGWTDIRVVTDGNIITSRGAGTAGLFATAIIARLVDEEAARKISASVLME